MFRNALYKRIAFIVGLVVVVSFVSPSGFVGTVSAERPSVASENGRVPAEEVSETVTATATPVPGILCDCYKKLPPELPILVRPGKMTEDDPTATLMVCAEEWLCVNGNCSSMELPATYPYNERYNQVGKERYPYEVPISLEMGDFSTTVTMFNCGYGHILEYKDSLVSIRIPVVMTYVGVVKYGGSCEGYYSIPVSGWFVFPEQPLDAHIEYWTGEYWSLTPSYSDYGSMIFRVVSDSASATPTITPTSEVVETPTPSLTPTPDSVTPSPTATATSTPTPSLTPDPDLPSCVGLPEFAAPLVFSQGDSTLAACSPFRMYVFGAPATSEDPEDGGSETPVNQAYEEAWEGMNLVTIGDHSYGVEVWRLNEEEVYSWRGFSVTADSSSVGIAGFSHSRDLRRYFTLYGSQADVQTESGFGMDIWYWDSVVEEWILSDWFSSESKWHVFQIDDLGQPLTPTPSPSVTASPEPTAQEYTLQLALVLK